MLQQSTGKHTDRIYSDFHTVAVLNAVSVEPIDIQHRSVSTRLQFVGCVDENRRDREILL